MHVIGEIKEENKFKSVYAVFEDKINADAYHKKNLNQLETIEIETVFPFFIIEEFTNQERYYKSITKEELEIRTQKIKELDTAASVYFNLWRIDRDLYNKNFPDESVLRGTDFHIHFTDTDMKEIETNGFDAYWDDIVII
ncbi:hypothetical protein [Aquimarina rubra]|uniref:Uncharacterized protein n=1 Tax=Aquimarina rubra TaxID=1920033 RepID=A0ABW5LFD1_9FLAO